MPRSSHLVYSTEQGRLCPQCQQPQAQCSCKQNSVPFSGNGTIYIHRETKGRKGKGVTLIKGLSLTTEELKVLARQFKKICGSGGTVKEGTIEIQGDYRELMLAHLLKTGYQAKLTGG